jgi:hypothetical protein
MKILDEKSEENTSMDGLGRHSRDKYAEIHKILREI